MNKPVIYYQFDHEKFRKHHMKKSYFSYINDGFGKVIKEEKELIKEISNNINVFTLEDRYQKRVNDFFDLRDNKNNERTYYAVKELERKK
jgi:Putative glycosyl/glycerophosphate transferases involved in teichoic acid biosynthesis TagF/TagB/EpsJ/RodC